MPTTAEVVAPSVDRTPLRRALSGWGSRNRRDLPWRRTRDPWEVLVAEVMLQQTQVARVVERWPAFLARFPDTAACASAPVGAVITAWSGLGYNRRAVHLHRTASVVEVEHGGRFPTELSALLALPGIGPYTARALLTFAYEDDVGVLDTNVGRVLARLCGRPLRPAEAQRLADELVPAGRGWAWNQTMLDLGATVCTSRTPRCDRCPVRRQCCWRAMGGAEPDPARGSAAVSGAQSRFVGSDRQGRGRLLDELRCSGQVRRAALADVAGWPDEVDRAERVAGSLVDDGLARWSPRGSLHMA